MEGAYLKTFNLQWGLFKRYIIISNTIIMNKKFWHLKNIWLPFGKENDRAIIYQKEQIHFFVLGPIADIYQNKQNLFRQIPYILNSLPSMCENLKNILKKFTILVSIKMEQYSIYNRYMPKNVISFSNLLMSPSLAFKGLLSSHLETPCYFSSYEVIDIKEIKPNWTERTSGETNTSPKRLHRW